MSEQKQVDPRIVAALDHCLDILSRRDLTIEEGFEVASRLLAGLALTAAHGNHIEAGKVIDANVMPKIRGLRAHFARGGRSAPRLVHGKKPH